MGCFSIASVLYVLAGVVTGEGPARERREREERAIEQHGIVVMHESLHEGKGAYY